MKYSMVVPEEGDNVKTDCGIAWLLYKTHIPEHRALIIRRNADDLRDWTDRAYQLYSKMGCQRAGNPPEFRWPSGAIFRTGHLKDDQAYTKYQGHEYQRMLIEELNQIPKEEMYLRLLASCRSVTPGINIPARIFLTTNPGGPGHSWVKARFVDPAPPGTPFKDNISGRTRIFIPSTMDDNPTLMEKDPDYVKSIDALRDIDMDLYRAWRHGDWDIFAGQVFGEFRRDKHVIERQFTPRSDIPHFLWIDWGYTAPFACLASALIQMQADNGEKFNRVITYQEWYGTGKYPDQWAKKIFDEAKCRKFRKAYVDPAMLNPKTDGTMSIGKQMMQTWRKLNNGKNWAMMERGNNRRNSQVPIIKNWLSMAPDGMPYWMMTENCVNLIRTLPLLIYDEHRVEEIDTEGEDHSCFSEDTLILTQHGMVAIVDVKIGDKVWTPVGWSKVLQKIERLDTLTTYRGIRVTANHPFLTQDGFRPVKDLKKMDRLWNVCILKDDRTGDILIQQNILIETIFAVVQRRIEATLDRYIFMSGNFFIKILKTVAIYIMLMGIAVTTILIILLSWIKQNILGYTKRIRCSKNKDYQEKKLLKSVALLLRKRLGHGIKAKQEKNGIRFMGKRLLATEKILLKFVKYAAKNSKRKIVIPDFAATTTKWPSTDGKSRVINLKTDTGMFTAGTAVVSNCDACSYGLKAIKFIGKLGGVGGHKNDLSRLSNVTWLPLAKIEKDGREKSLDLDLFITGNKKERNWRTI